VTADDAGSDPEGDRQPTAPERPQPSSSISTPAPSTATRPVYAAATVVDAQRSARLAAMTRVAPGAARQTEPATAREVEDAEAPEADTPVPMPGRFGRWVRKVALRTFLVVVILAGGGYLARSHLPPELTVPVEGWLRAVSQKVSAALMLLRFR